MNLITKRNLEKDLATAPKEIQQKAAAWIATVTSKEIEWQSFMDVCKVYANVSKVGKLYVFNIKHYRLVVGISFKRKTIYYKTIMSHVEYEKGDWKTKYLRAQ